VALLVMMPIAHAGCPHAVIVLDCYPHYDAAAWCDRL